VVFANPAGEDLLQHSTEVLRGTKLTEYILEDNPLISLISLARSRRNSASDFDIRLESPRIGEHSVTAHVAPLAMGDAGTYNGEVVVSLLPRGMTDALDQQLTNMTAGRSMSSMGSMLAHEIKNPLAGITGAAQLLSMGLKGEDLEMTDLIVAESRRIVALLDQVEHFGNQRPPQRAATNIHDLLDRACASASVGFAANMAVRKHYDPSLPATWVDGDQMLQVFLNLLKNASEAADNKGGTITVRTFYDMTLRLRRADGTGAALPLQVEIEDDGPGLPPEIAANAFDPFVSGRENGTGLGLALVSKIVADHDGWISVTTTPGRTVFRLSLPVAKTQE